MIGRNIKRVLERQGKTQRELAEDIGITEASMSRYIHGDRVPKATTLVKIANALGVAPDQLLSDKDNPIESSLTQKAIECEYYALCRHGRDENKLRSALGCCDYCTEDSDGYVKPIEKNSHAFIRFGMDGWELDLRAKGWHGSAKIMYCPMCGRRLKHG